MTNEISVEVIVAKIWEIRGKRVMLDSDLAKLYEVPTKALIQAIKRNIKRFPDDFMHQLTKKELDNLRSQFGVELINSVDDVCYCTSVPFVGGSKLLSMTIGILDWRSIDSGESSRE